MGRSHTMENIEDRLDSLKESVRDLVDFGKVKDTVVSGTRKTGSMIKEHPIVAIAVAFGIGYIAMRIMRR
jgi:ElaB/YqjD/DUF883 family membrane-anchored ribosome-binding protein